MTEHFYESSAFAKLFVQEVGTSSMLELYRTATRRCVSKLVFVEVHSAIRRVERERRLTNTDANVAASLLFGEQMKMEVVEMSDDILEEARRLLDRNPLRSLDAIQLASAKQIGALFVCADERLRKAALLEGLQVLDPNAQ